jgi:hypothetical protein
MAKKYDCKEKRSKTKRQDLKQQIKSTTYLRN